MKNAFISKARLGLKSPFYHLTSLVFSTTTTKDKEFQCLLLSYWQLLNFYSTTVYIESRTVWCVSQKYPELFHGWVTNISIRLLQAPPPPIVRRPGATTVWERPTTRRQSPEPERNMKAVIAGFPSRGFYWSAPLTLWRAWRDVTYRMTRDRDGLVSDWSRPRVYYTLRRVPSDRLVHTKSCNMSILLIAGHWLWVRSGDYDTFCSIVSHWWQSIYSDTILPLWVDGQSSEKERRKEQKERNSDTFRSIYCESMGLVRIFRYYLFVLESILSLVVLLFYTARRVYKQKADYMSNCEQGWAVSTDARHQTALVSQREVENPSSQEIF